ncbi:MAG: hypothetical protein MOB07_22725 [Acidobacteria bacterium]|nr:hypothetical protein [Acidobacteriota bacterium]
MQCDLIDGLTGDEKQRAKHALEYLRVVLGESFLKRAIARWHPLISLFGNCAPWTRLKLIGLAEALEAMRDAENFKLVLKRIKEIPSRGAEWKFTDGYSVLQTAHQFFKAGLQICFVSEKGSDKKPDIKLSDGETGEEVYVEVSGLRISAEVKRIEDLNRRVFVLTIGALSEAQLAMCGEMPKSFDESHLPTLMKRIREVIAEVKACGELRELIDEYIVAGIAPKDKIEQLNQWAVERGLSQGFAGPPMFFSEISRVQRKIREKLEQLPNDKPGIIVIPDLGGFLFHFYDLGQIIGELEKQVSDYPNLLAIVLSQGYADEPLSDIILERSGPHIIVNRMIAGCMKEPIVIVRNQALALSVSPAMLAKIERAFN